jgi:hypothetical protein
MASVIPRFLYHITNTANYKSIVSSGVLKTSKPESACNGGVFMVELTNFFKRWGVSKDWDGNLQAELLQKVAGNSGDVVILRIPTKEIDTNRLRVRSQNRLTPVAKLDKERRTQILDECADLQTDYIRSEMDKLDISSLSLEEFQKKCDIITRKAAEKFPFPENIDEPCVPISKHIIEGAPAKERKLFQQRKEAIEYIYPGNIPVSSIEKVGEADVSDIFLFSENKCSIRDIFLKLLKGAPEKKATILLNA